MPLSGVPEGPARTTVELLAGIVSFARWPTPRDPLRLCVVGPARFGAADLGRMRRPGRDVALTRYATRVAQPAACDVLYVGAVAPAVIRQSVAAVRGHDVLTIAQEDADCTGGTMFCLHTGAREIVFELNLDAVSRSGVAVDPRILRLSQGSAK